ncbi:MAG TPA: hypothetical protein VLW45_05305 [Pelomicrobium sp.]|nr:hypothetical protein [Pelomicrobium sp.]
MGTSMLLIVLSLVTLVAGLFYGMQQLREVERAKRDGERSALSNPDTPEARGVKRRP